MDQEDNNDADEQIEKTIVVEEDLEIIDPKNWDPTNEDILRYAYKLGFDLENDPEEFLNIAYKYLTIPIHQDWKRAIYKQTGEIVYINREQTMIKLMTEVEEAAQQAYLIEKEKYERLLQEEEAKKYKIIPRKKVPPIGKKVEDEFSKKKKELESAKNFFNQTPDQKVTPPNEKVCEESEPVKTNVTNKISKENDQSSPPSEMPRRSTKMGATKVENSEILNVATEKKKKEPSHITSTHNRTPPRNIKIEEEAKLAIMNQTKENAIQSHSPPDASIVANSDTRTLEDKKKEYYHSKLQELQDFELDIKETFHKSQVEYKNKKKELFKTASEEYEKTLVIEKRKNKDEHERQMKQKLEDMENQHATRMKNEQKIFMKLLEKEGINNRMQNDHENECQENENIISKILKERNLLIEQIEKEKTSMEQLDNNSVNQHQDNLDEIKTLIEERYDLEKQNQDSKYDLLWKETEISEEVEYNKSIERIKNSQLVSYEEKDKIGVTVSQNKLLESYQKTLDEGYEMQIKALQKEVEEKGKCELNSYKIAVEKDFNEKLIMYKKQTNDLEKDYYRDLNMTKEEHKQKNKKILITMKDKFDHMLDNFEILKEKVNEKINTTISDIITKLKYFTDNQSIDQDYLTIENQIEEYAINLLGDKMIECQRKKNSFELVESDYTEKFFLLDYFLEIAGFLVKMLIEKPLFLNHENMDQQEIEDQIVNELMKFSKEKNSEYQVKYNQIKEKKIFNFLESGYKKINITPATTQNSWRNQFNNWKMNESSSHLHILNDNFDSSNRKVVSNTRVNKEVPHNKFLSTERYENVNEEKKDTVTEKQKEVEITPKKADNEISYWVALPGNIINQLPQEEATIYCSINDFLADESSRLLKEYNSIIHKKNLYGQLKEITVNNPEDLIAYAPILNEDSSKNERKERLYSSKLRIFEKIKLHVSEVYNFIEKNIETTEHDSSIKEKLLLLLSNINDYNTNFNLGECDAEYNGLSKSTANSYSCSPCRLRESYDDKVNILAKSYQEAEKKRNTMSASQRIFNAENMNNTFSSFCTLYTRKSLHEGINL